MDRLVAEIEQLRRAAILRALYQRYPEPMGEGLILSTLADRQDLALTHEACKKALGYLADRQCVRLVPRTSILLAFLLPDGVDQVEQDPDFPAHERAVTRMLRLRVLQALSWNMGAAMGESLIRKAIKDDIDLDLTPRSIQRAMHYLSGRSLIEIIDRGGPARILPDGTDYLEGTGAAIVGIAKPFGT